MNAAVGLTLPVLKLNSNFQATKENISIASSMLWPGGNDENQPMRHMHHLTSTKKAPNGGASHHIAKRQLFTDIKMNTNNSNATSII